MDNNSLADAQFCAPCEALVDAALGQELNDEVLMEKFNISITREKLRCLRDGVWLNDEVVNFMVKLLQQRCARDSPEYPQDRSGYCSVPLR